MGKFLLLFVLVVLTFTGKAQSPHGNAFKTDCILCHTSESWKVSKTILTFDHNSTSFKLTGQHKAVDCISCHKTLKFKEAKSECISCHTDLHQNTVGPLCSRCHDTNSWTIKNSITLHKSTRFPLEGSHAVAECTSCHQSASNYQYKQLGVECVDCHRKDYTATQNPNHVRSGYPTDCVECHSVNAAVWSTTNFDHNTFPLTAGHNITCVECHKTGSYQKIATDCMSCHQVQFNAAKGHVASKFSADCKTCHNATNWLGATINHATTNFPLTGAHISVECASCHTTGYTGTSMECNSCHQKNFTEAKTPSHTAAGISNDCKTCHSSSAWQPSSFKHGTTGYELTGGHAAVVQCSECHLGNTTSAKTECISCHLVQYNEAKGHVASKFPTDCTLCHSSANWLGAKFDHSATNFPLTGSHVAVECASCHTSGYAGTSVECKSCHQPKYNSVQVPSHTAAGISDDCKTCHTATGWQPSTFNHTTTGFALSGGHVAVVQCSSCHKGNTTSATSDCISCHKVQYDGAKGHLASSFPTDCKMCHNSNNWLNAAFDHSKSGFPLTGVHATVVCASCHTSGVYTGLSAECKSCHQAKFNSAQVPSHTAAGISDDCKTCHTATGWQPSTFNHTTTGFALSGGHAAVVQCSSCHKGNTTSATSDCISCHKVQYDGAKGHLASSFPTDCKMCHNSNNWLNAAFDHSKSGFPLTGVHATVVCASCHTSGVYTGLSAECKSCHQAKFNAAQVPSHTAAGISDDCKTCHTATGWQPSTFNHTTTGFALSGGHAAVVQCSSCHKGNTTSATSDCISCHKVQYDGAKGHLASSFPTDCKMCHNSNNWLNASFDHSKSGFPLTGVHATVVCASCHTSGVYTGLSAECKACHQAKFNAAQVPSHTAAGISDDCKTCHTATGWQTSTFNHTTTGFALSGGHAAVVQCSSCHKGNTTSATSDCISCHKVQYDGAKGHLASSFPTDCKMCHNSNNWLNAAFDHSKSGFPLTGVHATVVCASCHTSGVYTGLSSECKSCHQAKFNAAQVPSHTAAGISDDCKTCHTATGWQPSTFNHTTTGFALSGGHAAVVQCSSCHKGNTTSATSDCISCHKVQYDGAKGHLASSFPTDCKMCHNSNNWLNASFDHSKSGFPLTGVHATVVCASCHSSGVYTGLSAECKSCHQTKFNAAQVPSHTAAGISDDCKTCHTATGWQPSTFNHTTTGFALSGGHAAVVQCSSCHKGNTTSATSDCISCHKVQYDGAKGHLASSFPTDCKMCHNSNNWLNASFDHSKSGFPLTGVHATVVCASCHTSGVYTGLSSECKSCHQAKFNAAQVPSHTAAGISDDCKTCHTATGWQPSTFNHTTTGFALSGGHAAVVQCSSCHKGNTTSATSDCISCHKVQYDGAKGHLASSFPTDCKMCHNSNNWLNASFDHSKSGFPLTGVHATVVCASCHTSGVYTGLSSECKSCHQAKFNAAQVPSHTAAGISDDCKTCHTATGWQPSTFNHTTTGFALSGGHAAVVQCSSCHKGNTTSATSDCISCHKVQYDGAPGHLSGKFPTDCKLCHNSNNWLGASFNHSQTAFPLTGAHTTADCGSCHSSGVYDGLSMECKSCHQTNYNAAVDPNHKTLALPVTCADCHTTNPGWKPASFAIHNNYYALTGAHSAIAKDCAACHKGTYVNTPNTCNGCHAADYNTATNPNHKTAQFPIDCATCHTSNAWSPSTFNHDAQYFPIYSGNHRGKWTLCSECHTSTTNFALFSCIKCHEHSNKTSVDNDHQGENGYTYTATSCYTCHPRGSN